MSATPDRTPLRPLSTNAWQFGDLGPAQLRRGSDVVQLDHRGQSSKLPQLLALLLALITESRVEKQLVRRILYDDTSRESKDPDNSLDGVVLRLRKVLEPNHQRRAEYTILLSDHLGYRLNINPATIDSIRSERLVYTGFAALGEKRTAAAADIFWEALGLWRGLPFEEVADHPLVQGRIEERVESLRVRRLDAMYVFLQIEPLGSGRDLRTSFPVAVGHYHRKHPRNERICRYRMLVELGIPRYWSDSKVAALEAYEHTANAKRDWYEARGITSGFLDERVEELRNRIERDDPAFRDATRKIGALLRRPSRSAAAEREEQSMPRDFRGP
jgi:hypothetical protein